ncbi:MAG: hypothetical protein QF893_20455 [Alphaproteobacteria bacterium]|nr:hypothetical protein [Alphaproteobacteria bacterium]
MSDKATAPTKESKKSDSKTSSEASTSSEPSTSSESSTSSEGGGGSGASSSSKGGGSSRPISYFSSVSTDDYRAGWDNVFSKKTPKRRAPAKTRRANGPATVELEMSELDADLRGRLEEAFRRKARAKRISYDRYEKNWRLVCEIDR